MLGVDDFNVTQVKVKHVDLLLNDLPRADQDGRGNGIIKDDLAGP